MADDNYWRDQNTGSMRDGFASKRRPLDVRSTQSTPRFNGLADPNYDSGSQFDDMLTPPATPEPAPPAESLIPDEEFTDEEIDQKALYDSTSGAFNFRYMIRLLNTEMVRSAAFGRPFSILVVSIDNFLKLAMDLGPDALDRFVADLALTLMNGSRSVDKICKYLESRFIIICPEADVAQAIAIAENVRKTCNRQNFGISSSVRPVTISIGVSCSSDGLELESLIALGDLGADLISEQGGNACCYAPDAV